MRTENAPEPDAPPESPEGEGLASSWGSEGLLGVWNAEIGRKTFEGLSDGLVFLGGAFRGGEGGIASIQTLTCV